MDKVTEFRRLSAQLTDAEQDLAEAKTKYLASRKRREFRQAVTDAQVTVRTLEIRAGAIFKKLEQLTATEVRLWKSSDSERWVDGEGVYHYGYPDNYLWSEGEYDKYKTLCTFFGFRPMVGKPTKTTLEWGME